MTGGTAVTTSTVFSANTTIYAQWTLFTSSPEISSANPLRSWMRNGFANGVKQSSCFVPTNDGVGRGNACVAPTDPVICRCLISIITPTNDVTTYRPKVCIW
jgi:hypothetical protein